MFILYPLSLICPYVTECFEWVHRETNSIGSSCGCVHIHIHMCACPYTNTVIHLCIVMVIYIYDIRLEEAHSIVFLKNGERQDPG